jgi:hypothetical protein
MIAAAYNSREIMEFLCMQVNNNYCENTTNGLQQLTFSESGPGHRRMLKFTLFRGGPRSVPLTQ